MGVGWKLYEALTALKKIYINSFTFEVSSFLHFNYSHLAPSLIQYLTTLGLGFSFMYVGDPAPLLNTRVPEVSSATDVLLSSRSLVKLSLGMRFPKLLFSSQESNFLTRFTCVCLLEVERNV